MAIVYEFAHHGGITGPPLYRWYKYLTTPIAKPYGYRHPVFEYLKRIPILGKLLELSIDRHERTHEAINKRISSPLLAKIIGELSAYPVQALYLIPDTIRAIKESVKEAKSNPKSKLFGLLL